MKRLFGTMLAMATMIVLLANVSAAENSITKDGVRSVARVVKDVLNAEIQLSSEGGEFDVSSGTATLSIPSNIFYAASASLTITNMTDHPVTLCFDYEARNYASFMINGVNGEASGTYSVFLQAHGSMDILLVRKTTMATLVLSNFSLKSGTTPEHSYSAEITPPTCIAGGYTTYTCTKCGNSYIAEETPAVGHDYASAVTAPTCTEEGYTTYTCVNCSDSYTADATAPNGHNYTTEVTEPTCIADGYTTYACDICGHSYTDNQIEPVGHSYELQVIPPACDVSGYTTYACACGDSYVAESIEPLGHDYILTARQEPTCLVSGQETYTCQRDAAHIAYKELPASGHRYAEQVTAPTCTASGFTIYTCPCGDSYTADVTQALGHNFAEGVINRAPTCTEPGEGTSTCQRENCGVTDKLTIPATGHAEATDPAVQPGCTTDGWTEGKHCAVCGKVLLAQEKLPAAHQWQNVPGAAGVMLCGRCDEMKIDQAACSEGLVRVGGAYYYIQEDGTIAKEVTMLVEKTNGLAPEGIYTFGADGRMELRRVPGDADNSGSADILDALRIMQYDSGENVIINLENADVNGSGKADIHDALLIFQYEAGWDVTLK